MVGERDVDKKTFLAFRGSGSGDGGVVRVHAEAIDLSTRSWKRDARGEFLCVFNGRS